MTPGVVSSVAGQRVVPALPPGPPDQQRHVGVEMEQLWFSSVQEPRICRDVLRDGGQQQLEQQDRAEWRQRPVDRAGPPKTIVSKSFSASWTL